LEFTANRYWLFFYSGHFRRSSERLKRTLKSVSHHCFLWGVLIIWANAAGPSCMTKKYRYNKKNYTLSELSEISGINLKTLRKRLVYGFSVKRAVETPLKIINKKYRYKGKTRLLSEISELSGISYTTLKYRLTNCGMSFRKAIETPVTKARILKYKGKNYTIAELSTQTGIDQRTIRRRLTDGMSTKQALATQS